MTEITIATLESPQDPRDYVAEQIFPPDVHVPEVYDPRDKLLPVRSQGAQGSCLGESTACIKELQERKNVGFEDYFSPQFIYNNRENQDTQGMYTRDCMRILYKHGVPPEEDYPYGRVEDPSRISQRIKDIAANYKIKGYATINTIETLKVAIYRNGGAIITFRVYGSSPEFWRPTKEGDVPDGMHACAVVGWTKDGFIIRNSWGSKFGDNGYVIYPYSEWGAHGEIWTTIDDESSKPDPRYSRWYWKTVRACKNIVTNFKQLRIIAISCIMLIVAGTKDWKALVVLVGVLGYTIYSILKHKYYLTMDKP